MAKNPTAEEAIERARALQESKIDAVRVLAESNQELEKAQERVLEAERVFARAFGAASSAGWGVDELRKIGFTHSVRKSRGKQPSSVKPEASS